MRRFPTPKLRENDDEIRKNPTIFNRFLPRSRPPRVIQRLRRLHLRNPKITHLGEKQMKQLIQQIEQMGERPQPD